MLPTQRRYDQGDSCGWRRRIHRQRRPLRGMCGHGLGVVEKRISRRNIAREYARIVPDRRILGYGTARLLEFIPDSRHLRRIYHVFRLFTGNAQDVEGRHTVFRPRLHSRERIVVHAVRMARHARRNRENRPLTAGGKDPKTRHAGHAAIRPLSGTIDVTK